MRIGADVCAFDAAANFLRRVRRVPGPAAATRRRSLTAFARGELKSN
jgi:hypothetical protein